MTIVGAFPYTAGRAYGVLLDDLLPAWRREVRATSDLGDMLTVANNRPLTANLGVAAARYDAPTMRIAVQNGFFSSNGASSLPSFQMRTFNLPS